MGTDLLVVGPFYDWDLQKLAEGFTLHHMDAHDDPRDMPEPLRAGLRFATLKGHAPLNGAFMDAFPALEVIANYGVGYDAIDVVAASARGIRVTNTPDVLTADVADHTVLMLLSHLRQSHAAEDWLRRGEWAKGDEFTLQRKMSGGHVGIVGLGRIGRAIADRLAAFEMQVSYYSRAPKDVPSGWTHYATPESLAAAVDFLVIALSGGPDTEKLVSAETIRALGPNGVLVNVSRGTTVDEDALIQALSSGALGGAALDVFLNEPTPDPRFFDLPNVLMQPHIASATVETRQAMGQLVVDNLVAARDGAPLLTPVN